MLGIAENLPDRPLQRAEYLFAAGLVIVIPDRHGDSTRKRLQEAHGPPENAEIVCRRGLVARFNRHLTRPMPTTAAVRSASVQTIERRFMALSA